MAICHVYRARYRDAMYIELGIEIPGIELGIEMPGIERPDI